ncbi:MAG TPA: hypothetical protein VF014_01060, partial [Casimicrobiaceae bacterium]|nr:hypothetical protein [Casimicrobiaceae bacterium]
KVCANSRRPLRSTIAVGIVRIAIAKPDNKTPHNSRSNSASPAAPRRDKLSLFIQASNFAVEPSQVIRQRAVIGFATER